MKKKWWLLLPALILIAVPLWLFIPRQPLSGIGTDSAEIVCLEAGGRRIDAQNLSAEQKAKLLEAAGKLKACPSLITWNHAFDSSQYAALSLERGGSHIVIDLDANSPSDSRIRISGGPFWNTGLFYVRGSDAEAEALFQQLRGLSE